MHQAIRHLKTSDNVLAALIEKVGPYRIEFRDPSFETLVRSIVFQQLSGKVARAIYDRLRHAVPGGRMTPQGILKLRPDKMRRLAFRVRKRPISAIWPAKP
jgi:DNA-3-methyladenine glycosylase II